MTQPLRIGVLGCSRIAVSAAIEAARLAPEAAIIIAVAARDPARAQAYATLHGIPHTHASYAALLADPDIDAVYNPLPNSLHAEWSIKALRAGKHVLCEKPFASNASDAETMAAAARTSGRVLSEAFAWRHHPIAERVARAIHGGQLGTLKQVHAEFRIPLIRPDIRWNFALAGGGLMDVGCYPISWLHFLATEVLGQPAPRVVSARAKTLTRHVDRFLQAELDLGAGVRATLVSAMLSPVPFAAFLTLTGSRGTLRIDNPYHPQTRWVHHRVTASGAADAGAFAGLAATNSYACQLRAFARAVRGDGPIITDAALGVAHMRLIDAAYLAAGLPLRGV